MYDSNETAADRLAAMREVLLHIHQQRPIEQLSAAQLRILKDCYDAGYLDGVALLEMISGRIVAEYRGTPRLTLSGLRFLDDPTGPSRKDDERNKPDKADRPGKKDRSGKNIYQSESFWAAITLFATVLLWLLDRILA